MPTIAALCASPEQGGDSDVAREVTGLLVVLVQAGRTCTGGQAQRGAENKKKKTNDTRFLVLFARESGQKWLRRSRPMVYYARWICPLFTYISCTFGHFPCEFCRCFYRSVWSQVATWP